MRTATPQEVTAHWLRFSEAERYAGLGRTTLTRLISEEEIVAAKVGKSVRINRASLEAYMMRQVTSDDEN